MLRRSLVPALLLVVGCAGRPQPIDDGWVLRQVSSRYRHFYPGAGDPDPDRDAGLLRPRFGLPAVVQAGAAFPVELLERGGPHALQAALLRPDLSDEQARRCLDQPQSPPAGCHPLALGASERAPVTVGGTSAVR